MPDIARTIQITARAVDKATGTFKEVQEESESAAVAAQEAWSAASQSIREDVGAIRQQVVDIGRGVQGIGKDLTKKLTVPISASAGAAATAASRFEAGMRPIQSMLGRTSQNMNKVSRDVRNLSSDLGVLPERGQSAFQQIVSSGRDGQTALKNLSVSAKAAQGFNANLTSTTNALIKTMNNFGDELSGPTQAMNKMVASFDTGLFTFEQLSTAFPRVAKQASSIGVSMNEAAAAFGQVSNSAASVNQAATGTARLMTSLQKPTEDMAALMERFGASTGQGFIEQQGGLRQALLTVREAVENSDKELTDFFKNIQGFKGAQSLINNLDELKKSTQNVANSQGRLNDIWQQATEDLDVAFGRVMSATNNLLITMGNDILPIVTPLINGLADAIQFLARSLQQLPHWLSATISGIVAITAVIGPLIYAVGSLVVVFGKWFAISTLLSSFLNTGLLTSITLLIDPLLALATAIGQTLFPSVVSLSGIMSTFVGSLSAVASVIFSWALPALLALPSVIAVIDDVWEDVTTGIGNAVNRIQTDLKRLYNAFASSSGDIVGELKSIAAFLTVDLRPIWESFWVTFTAVVESAWKTLTTVVSIALRTLRSTLLTTLKLLQGDWKGAMNELNRFSREVFNDLSEWFKSQGNIFKSLVSNLDSIRDQFTVFFVFVSSIFSALESTIAIAINSIAVVIVGLVQEIVMIKEVFLGLKSVVTGAVQGIANLFVWLKDKVKKTFADMLEFVILKMEEFLVKVAEGVQSIPGIDAGDLGVADVAGGMHKARVAVQKYSNGIKKDLADTAKDVVNSTDRIAGGQDRIANAYATGKEKMADRMEELKNNTVKKAQQLQGELGTLGGLLSKWVSGDDKAKEKLDEQIDTVKDKMNSLFNFGGGGSGGGDNSPALQEMNLDAMKKKFQRAIDTLDLDLAQRIAEGTEEIKGLKDHLPYEEFAKFGVQLDALNEGLFELGVVGTESLKTIQAVGDAAADSFQNNLSKAIQEGELNVDSFASSMVDSMQKAAADILANQTLRMLLQGARGATRGLGAGKGSTIDKVLTSSLQNLGGAFNLGGNTKSSGGGGKGILSTLLGSIGGYGKSIASGAGTAASSAFGFVQSMFFEKGAAFASGGVVDQPTTFPMQKGAGLMAEAGDEAIMPLSRNSRGELGVKSDGDGGGGSERKQPIRIVNVDSEKKMQDFMESGKGERTILNAIQKNNTQVKEMVK